MFKISVLIAFFILTPSTHSTETDLEENDQRVVQYVQDSDEEVSDFDLMGSMTIALNNQMLDTVFRFCDRMLNDQSFREKTMCSLMLASLCYEWLKG